MIDMQGDAANRSFIEYDLQRQFHLERTAYVGHDLQCCQRVAATGKKIVAAANAGTAQHTVPDFGQGNFGGRLRRC